MSGRQIRQGYIVWVKEQIYGDDKSGKRYKKMKEIKDILKHDFNFMIFIIDEIL